MAMRYINNLKLDVFVLLQSFPSGDNKIIKAIRENLKFVVVFPNAKMKLIAKEWCEGHPREAELLLNSVCSGYTYAVIDMYKKRFAEKPSDYIFSWKPDPMELTDLAFPVSSTPVQFQDIAGQAGDTGVGVGLNVIKCSYCDKVGDTQPKKCIQCNKYYLHHYCFTEKNIDLKDVQKSLPKISSMSGPCKSCLEQHLHNSGTTLIDCGVATLRRNSKKTKVTNKKNSSSGHESDGGYIAFDDGLDVISESDCFTSGEDNPEEPVARRKSTRKRNHVDYNEQPETSFQNAINQNTETAAVELRAKMKQFTIITPQENKSCDELPLKQDLKNKVLKYFVNPLLDLNNGVPLPGFIFYGESGSGKTTLAKWIAKKGNINFMPVDCGNVTSKYHGESDLDHRKDNLGVFNVEWW